MLYVGEGSEREQWCLLCSLPDFSHFPCYPQSNWALLVLLPNVRACAHSRPLWISPTNSPVRLGVSPAAASTPTGVLNQRFEALFPRTGALGYVVCFAPPPFVPFYLCTNMGLRGATHALPAPFSATLSPALLVYLCTNVGPQGLLVVRLPAPFFPHSASLGPAMATRILSALAAHLCPSYRSGLMFIFYFLGVVLP